jgi:diaminopimelate epimerase
MELMFFKYQATGNDFIIMDHRQKNLSLSTTQIEHLCHRRFGIGADGLILFQLKEGFDFEMKYFNSDGKESTMCGNGGRCIVQFALQQIGMKKDKYHFWAADGPHEATIEENGWVHLKMKDVEHVEKYYADAIVNTGSPHYVKLVEDAQKMNVKKEGRAIRNSSRFKQDGINVDFVQEDTDAIYVRTYERGVEDETLSCGTGVTAAALIMAHNERGFNRIDVTTLGGKLAVEFEKTGDETFSNIWLCGPAEYVFKGFINVAN